MPTYQSKIVEVAPTQGETFAQTAQRVMDEKGAEGWRFVSYTRSESPSNPSHYFFFQREVTAAG